jgi:uncharacterized protein
MRIIYLHGFASGPLSKKAAFFRRHIAHLEIPDLANGDFEHLTVTGQLAVIETLAGGDPVALVGSSMGGYLAAAYAARHPEVAKLVLLAPAFGFARRWAESPDADEWKRAGFLNVYHYAAQGMRKLGYQLIEDALLYDDYPNFAQPALIFHGIHDTVVPPEFSRLFAGTHPNARLRLLDSDHELLNALDAIWLGSRSFLLP